MDIELLGPLVVRDGPTRRKLAGRQGALLAALALHAGNPVSTDRLIDVVWGDDPPGDAANALQQRVSRLRGVIDPIRDGQVLVQSGGGYMLCADDDQVDVRRFERLAAEGRRRLTAGDASAAEAALSQALGLWRGPVLDGFADELWAVPECRRLEELRLAAAEDRAELLIALGEHDRALSELGQLAAAHPLRERMDGLLMQALYATGRQADALAVYDQTRRLLAEELGVDPSPQLQRIYHQILAQENDLHAERKRRPASGGNLSAPRSRVVGREPALEQVAQLLSHTRLLTITGPGGAGKTTLAVEAARRSTAPADGSWLVELAPVATGDAVVTAIADVLGVTGGGLGTAGVDAAALLRILTGRRALLLLDNCEHLLDTIGPLVEQLLTEAHDVQVLATSREPLGLAGEVIWSVPGLGVPEERHTTIDEVLAAPAVELLAERARAHTPAFALTDDTARDAATLVRRLDGIPLAIELAAARLRVLSLTELANALDDRFRVLTARRRTGASRHRTLRAALDWSWELLDEPLQRAWATLAVPADRFDLVTASRLLGAVGVDTDALDVVADLVDRSLLTADTSAAPTRYRMLESLRHYGQQRLAEQRLADDIHTAHAEVVEAALAACNTDPAPERFTVDIDGLAGWLDDARVALRWAHERGDRGRVQRLAGLLGWLWLLRGRSAEGLNWLDRGLPPPERVGEADDATALLWASALRAAGVRAPDGHRWADVAASAATTAVDRVVAQVCAAGHNANAGRLAEATAVLDACDTEARELGGWPLGFVRLIGGQLAWVSGDPERARVLTEQAVELLSAAGADWAHVHAQEILIDEAAARGDHRRAGDLAREALSLCRRHGYPELEAAMLTKLGRALEEMGDVEHAVRLVDEAVSRAAAVGSASALADAHTAAGAAARHRGDLETARKHLDQAQQLLSELQSVPETVEVHVELAFAAAQAGQGDIGAAHADEALSLARQLGDPRMLGRCLESFAGALAASGESQRAVATLATAAAIRDSAGVATSPSQQHDVQRIIDRLRASSDHTFEATWAAAHERAAAHPGQAVARIVAARADEAIP